MKFKKSRKRAISVLLSVLIMLGCLTPCFSAFAEDHGVIGVYDVEIFYDDNTLVPTYQDDGETEFIVYMMEGDKRQFNYQFVDCTLPDNGYVKWSSDTPTVCDVTEDGIVRAFDSSKGAAVRLWLDNEVGTIPLVGSLMKQALEKVLFNEYVNVDTMDTDSIIKLVEDAFGSESILARFIDSYKGQLVDSLRSYLDKVNTVISCTMYDADGKVLDVDKMSVCVTKSDAPYADFLPNGTHITNKQDLPTTVAKGSKLQLYACTTPTRLHMGVIYSVKSSSIFSNGKVVATVDDSGLITFKNTGTVTILVSPDTDGFIENLLKYINYIYALDNTGTIDSGKVADVLIKYIGLDINRTVLMGILDAAFAIKDIAGGTADPVQLTATAVKVIANIILQFTTNDSITFTVVDGVPCTDFEITGANQVQEGNQIQLSIENAKPEAADTSDITWSSSDPSIASVDPVTGVITGRDAGGSLGAFSSQDVIITATSAANNVSKSHNLTVVGKPGRYLSDVEIVPDRDELNIGEEQYITANIYPKRAAEADNLYVYWGVVTGGTSPEDYEYSWASDPYQLTGEDGEPLFDGENNPMMSDGTATNGIGTIDKNGKYTAVAGGTCTIACRAVTGYYVLDGTFYQISEVISTKEIFNGQPVKSIGLEAVDVTSGGTLSSSQIEINGQTYKYATVKKSVAAAYYGNGCVVKANIEPSNATNKHLTWYIDNSDYEKANQNDEQGTIEIKMKAAVEKASSVNVYCMSADGSVKSEVLTITVTRNYATGNSIDGENLSVINGKTLNVSHTMSFDDSWEGNAYACHDANWYSSDEDVLSVESKDSETGNAVLRGKDVGVATLICVSSDGSLKDTRTVTVYPDKSNLESILSLCEKTIVQKTEENAEDYETYMRCLDYAYYLDEDVDLPSQTTVDTYADKLLYIFYKLGGYISLNGISILNESGNDAGDYVSVPVNTVLYTRTNYRLDYLLNPKNCMYSNITWTSSSDSVKVDKYGVCTPTSNNECYSTITVTARDYMGNEFSDSVLISFAKTPATGVELSPESVVGAKAGETQQFTATVTPKNVLGKSSASIQDVVWATSDEEVATVDQSGLVTYVYGGDCVITATSVDGGLVGSCSVNVVTNYDPLQSLVNTYSSLSLSPENYYPDSYNYFMETLNEAMQMIYQQSATQNEVRDMCKKLEDAYNGLKKYNYLQRVELYLDGEASSDYYQYDISIFKEGLSYKNAELDLNVRLYPNNASYEKVTWESSSDIILVDDSGVCTIRENSSCYGRITCTVTDHFGNSFSDDVWVSFARYPVTAIHMSESSIAGAKGGEHQLAYTLEPTGDSLLHIGAASIKDVFWSSDNEEVASVDQTGLVTFNEAGATKVRVTSYDGGYSAECIVSTEGDRSALIKAVEKYADIDYMDYKYDYGMAFKNAYEEALKAVEDTSYTQKQIDAATSALEAAGAALAGHEFSFAENVSLDVKIMQQKTSDWSQNEAYTLSNDATAVSKKADNSYYTQRTRITLDGKAYPASDDYVSASWEILDKSGDTDVEINGGTVSVNPHAGTYLTLCSKSAKATLRCTITDSYGRTVSRTVNVVVAEETVTSVSLDSGSVTRYADAGTFKLNATVSPDKAGIKDIIWRSNNEDVATVGADGTVTPVNTGRCVITAETFDGGHTATCEVVLNTNFGNLANLYSTYAEFLNEVGDENIYTPNSLAVLQEALQRANVMLNESIAMQRDVDAMIKELTAAYDGLVKYVPVSGLVITAAQQDNVTVPHDGFIRFQSTSINNASFMLGVSASPADSYYSYVEWTSSNPDISVSENGIVTKSNSVTPEYALITATTHDEAGNTCSASVYVSFVRIAVTEVTLDTDMVFGAPQEQVKLNPTVSSGSRLTVPSITQCVYESENSDIASVDENGMVTFNTRGNTTITVRSVDGGFSATVEAYTTWDSTALTAAINQYAAVDYTDYAYDYGMAFKAAYENAVAVRDNVASDQTQIDTALQSLQTAYNNLAGHEFIVVGDLQLVSGGVIVENGANYGPDENGKVVVTPSFNEGAMIKSKSFTFENAQGVTAETTDSSIVITKTTEDPYGTIDVTFTAIDDYDRETTVTRSMRIVDEVLPISDFKFIYEGEEVTSVTVKSTASTSLGMRGMTAQLGVKTYPETAESYKQIYWSSSNSKISVDQTGLVTLTQTTLGTSNYTAVITCTVTLKDGSSITHTIQVAFTR